MAKIGKRSRVRVFFAEFEGDDETIQEGMRAMSVAVAKTFQPARVVHYLPKPTSDGETPVASVDDEELEDPELEDALDQPLSSSTPRPKRKPPTMSLVKNLDLRPAGKQSLREFVAEKKPKQQNSRIAVVVYYLCKVLEIKGVTANHVYTGCRDIEMRTPVDLPQTMRVIAFKNGWIETSNAEDIKITTAGENHVLHDLPRPNPR
jgi:hypothetical protein